MLAYLIVIYTVCGIYMLLNFKRDIHMLQQNSYRIKRYYHWLENGDLWSAWRLVDVALLLLLFSTLLQPSGAALVIGIAALVKICFIFTRKSKKPLVFTKRVWRIYSLTGILAAAAFVATAVCTQSASYAGFYNPICLALGVLLILTIFSWAVVVIAVWLLKPVEKTINQKYYDEAASILRSMTDLKVIGITGSYGKTSTKHYLNRILSEKYDVLMTPGSYNTPMGVIRTIRELMKPYNQVFICEMGAKQKGDVKEICDLVHPTAGIITAVGPMHLETFKSLANVQATKFELADAIPADGLVVINNDFEACAERKVTNTNALRYAVSHPDGSDYRAEDVRYTPQGTTFTVVGPDGFRLELTTRLVGESNIANLLGAVVMALYMKVPEERIRYAVAAIEQVEHRLNIKQTPGGVTIIDDAFNSNPIGSKMAVDVLSHFTDGRRIIVTPGMIELGDEQFNLNRELGAYIGGKVDIAIIVGAYNREALEKGVRSTDFNTENLYIVESFAESQKLLAGLLRRGDTVLYENDLPDTFK